MSTRVGEAWYEIGARVDRLHTALGTADQRIKTTGDNAERNLFSRLTSGAGRGADAILGIGKAALMVGGVGAIALGGLGVMAVTQAAKMESMSAAWEVMLGSADAAQSRMAELTTFAAKTPFAIPEVMQASRTLQVFGGTAQATGANLTLVGDIAAGVQQPIGEVATWMGRTYDAMKNGQPFGEAAQRLQEMGAMSGDGRRALEGLAKSVKDGTMTMDEAWPKAQGVFAQFGGMMERQSATMSGQWSNLMDNIGQAMVGLGMVVLPVAKEIVAALNAAIPAIKEGLVAAFERAEPVLRTVGDVLGDVIAMIGALFDTGSRGQVFEDQFGGFGLTVAAAADLVMTVLPQMLTLVEQVFGAIVATAQAVWPVVMAVVQVALATMKAVAEEVLPRLGALFTWIQAEVLPPLQEAFAAIAAWVQENWPAISGVIDAAAKMIGAALDMVIGVLMALWPVVVEVGRVVLPILGVAMEILLPVIQRLFEMFAQAFTDIGNVVTFAINNVIRPVVEAVMGFFSDVFLPAIEGVGAAFSAVWEAVSGFFSGIWNGMLSMVGDIVSTMIGVIKNLVGVAASIPGPWQDGAKEMKASLEDMQANVDTWGTTTTGSLTTTFAEQTRLASGGAAGAARAYADGWEGEGGYLSGAVGRFLGKSQALLKSLSPPKEGPFRDIDKYGANTADAYAEGWASRGGVLRDTIEGMLGAALPAAADLGLTGGLSRRIEVELVHRVVDPSGALATVPGGAAGVAAQLQRGLDASGLLRRFEFLAALPGLGG